MTKSMTQHSSPTQRALLAALVLILAGSGGCGWFGGKKRASIYASSPESRPLELPPDLNAPATDPTMVLPELPGQAPPAGVGEAPPAAGGGATAREGFQLSDTPASAWRRLGLALARIEGASVVSAAQVLGSYEVNFGGQTFLVRAQAEGEGTRISAVSTDGKPLTSGPAAELLGLLRKRLG